MKAIPGSPVGARDIRFATNTAAKREIPTNPNPIGLRFTEPMQQTVTTVPATVRYCGRWILRVEEFHKESIVIGAQLPGIQIAAEVSYRHD